MDNATSLLPPIASRNELSVPRRTTARYARLRWTWSARTRTLKGTLSRTQATSPIDDGVILPVLVMNARIGTESFVGTMQEWFDEAT